MAKLIERTLSFIVEGCRLWVSLPSGRTAHIWKECVVVKVEEEVPQSGESKGNGQERECTLKYEERTTDKSKVTKVETKQIGVTLKASKQKAMKLVNMAFYKDICYAK